jgi:hypothetical protein
VVIGDYRLTKPVKRPQAPDEPNLMGSRSFLGVSRSHAAKESPLCDLGLEEGDKSSPGRYQRPSAQSELAPTHCIPARAPRFPGSGPNC